MQNIKFAFLLCCLIAFSMQETLYQFTVESLENVETPCNTESGFYSFVIKGSFDIPVTGLSLELELESPKNAKADCRASSNGFDCSLDLVINPITEKKILVTTKEPTSEIFDFENWEGVIGAKPGTSNKVGDKDIECAVDITNTYTVNEMESEEQFFGLRGNWKKDKKTLTLEDFQLVLSNDKTASCSLNDENKNEILCIKDDEEDKTKPKFNAQLFRGDDGKNYKIQNGTSYLALSIITFLLGSLLF